ncbi:hypothetical protein Glove_585g9 [Diversispora epigaea]|uniref:Uncharacterized protein n=1 Tax=Diversispora epigaea TaxID=1348612 RepID=A0A397G9Y0_9GLOM|nr:hypothetical protein Glove_585g9 [Diversispora epigaea]
MSGIEIHEASTSKDKDNKGKGVGAETIEEESIKGAGTETIKEEPIKEETIDDILTPELKEVYKKLDRRMKERYHKFKTDEAKISMLETTIYERKRGFFRRYFCPYL